MYGKTGPASEQLRPVRTERQDRLLWVIEALGPPGEATVSDAVKARGAGVRSTRSISLAISAFV
jgi:hypothetical protein